MAPRTATRAVGVVGEFFSGFALLFRGFAWWKRRPRLMLLGLVPALIVAVALIALILVIATNAEAIVTFLTPFANSWDPGWARFFRVFVALALLIGFVVLAALRTRSARVVGFGVAVHVCFLVPGGAVLVMPAAVAGATHLARFVLDEVDAEGPCAVAEGPATP